jgi:Transglycosylase SLT domain/Putative peptidoglycan binding domain/LysM domain
MRLRTLTAVLAAAPALILASPAVAATTNPQIPGLQVALRAHGLYKGPIDGIAGPKTRAAVVAFQRRRGLAVDGIAGPRTRVALGRLGVPLLGRRVVKRGTVGYDVSVLQFQLKARGLLRGAIDGRFGPATEQAVRKLQRRKGLTADGVVGPVTMDALGPFELEPQSARATRTSAGGRHVVRAGETLTSIAARYGTTVPKLARQNRLDPRRWLVVGTRLRVPKVAASSTASVAAAVMGSFDVRASIDRWSAHYGVDARLAKALAWMESGFQAHVVSPAGAFGVMQVTPATWEFVENVLVGARIPRTADGNVRVGVAFLRHLLRTFGGDEHRALAAYYQGPKSVQTLGILPVSRAYIADVLALKSRF